ncbi:MAG: TetR/AcrR family transcriptional regulator [Actinophytocola sp.]|uniref:TetR/AcrR family transcriptional regulator n=1 Tax=Actinophytocola sp. TaxID=1872138 RepID=UPI003D6BC365
MRSPKGERTFVDIARRAQLIECTIDAIDDVGYQKASLAEIARRAGITKGAIFYHFANRDELIEAVFTHVLTAGTELIMSRIRLAETPRAQLRAYVEAFVESLHINPRGIRVLYAIGDHITDEEGRPRLVHDRNLQEAAIAQLVDILRRGQEAHEFGEFDTRSMAMMIRATIEAMPTYAIAYPDLDIDGYGADLMTFFERALQAGQPPKPRSRGR